MNLIELIFFCLLSPFFFSLSPLTQNPNLRHKGYHHPLGGGKPFFFPFVTSIFYVYVSNKFQSLSNGEFYYPYIRLYLPIYWILSLSMWEFGDFIFGFLCNYSRCWFVDRTITWIESRSTSKLQKIDRPLAEGCIRQRCERRGFSEVLIRSTQRLWFCHIRIVFTVFSPNASSFHKIHRVPPHFWKYTRYPLSFNIIHPNTP